jgi:hypothetical protein
MQVHKKSLQVYNFEKGNVYSLLQNTEYLHGAQYVNPGQQCLVIASVINITTYTQFLIIIILLSICDSLNLWI